MPNEISLRQKFLFFSFIILAGNGLISYAVYKSYQNLLESEQWVEHTEQVIHQSNIIFSIGKDIETASRGFVITNDSTFLEPLLTAEKKTLGYIEQLKQLTQDNPGQQQQIDSLNYYTQQRLDFAFQAVELRHTQGLATAIAHISTQHGKHCADRVQQITNAIQQEEGTLLKQRKQTNERSETTLNGFLLVIYILMGLFTIFSLMSLNKTLFQNEEKGKQKAELIKYKHFFYNNLDLACFANLEGYFEELNENFTKVLGYTKKDLLNRKFFEFIHPDDIEPTLKVMEKLSAGHEAHSFINRFKTKSGTYKYLEWSSIVNLETKKLYAIARDITEEVLADEELAFQNVEKEKRAAELIIANKELVFQNDEKEKRAAELTLANKELAFQNEEKEKRAAELIIANKELAFQNREKENRAAELIIANKELIFQNDEKENRAAELIIANKELAFQNDEKEKRAAELIIANNELHFQNEEKEKRAAELIIANKELAFQNQEKEKRAAELIIANKELIFQNEEKENRAAELIIANEELAFQNQEKENRAAELIIANNELAFQNEEKEKRAAELVIANKELAFQNEEKEKRAAELIIANKELAFQNEEKEKTEQELLQSERRLAKAQQLAHMGSWEIDLIHNTQTWSEGMFNIYRINNKEQPSTELFLSFVHPNDLAFATDNIERSFSTLGDSSFNFRFIRKDGEVRYGYSESRFEFDQNKRPLRLFGIVRDISERVKAKENLSHSENRFRVMIEKSTDMKTLSTREGEMIYGSPSIMKVLGYTVEEFISRFSFDFIHPDDIPGYKVKRQDILQTPGKSFYNQNRFLHKNGNWIWCEGTVTNMLHEPGINALVSNFRDITEKRIGEDQREFDRNNLKALINNTDDLLWSVDRNLKLITSNEPFDEMVKLLSGHVIEKGNDILNSGFSKEHLTRYENLYERAFLGETFTVVEYNSLPAEVWSEISYYPIRQGDEIIGTACHSHDITERKLAELERTKITNDLIQRNKDLEQFSYIVSHNLRAPVANIIGFSAAAQNENLYPHLKKDVMVGLSHSAKKLDDVIMDLNSILQTKLDVNQKKEMVYFSKIAGDIYSSIENLIEKEKATLTWDFSETDEMLTLKSYLHSIFYNLISNSLKYRQPDIPPVIEITSRKLEGKIEFLFKDNGMGIDLKKRGDQVFGLYKRFHIHSAEGKGMGLYMVKTQVETMGGKISISSEVNKGTEFKIEFAT